MKQIFLVISLIAPFSLYAQSDLLPGVSETAASPPHALPVYHPGFTIAASVGSAGGGLAIGHSINRRFAARLGVNAFIYSGKLKSGKDSDDLQIGFDYKIKLQTINALIDYYPFDRAGIRLTGELPIISVRSLSSANQQKT